MTRRGFTLLEIMVAIVVASLVLLTAGRMLAAVQGASSDLDDRMKAHADEMNAERWLSRQLQGLVVGGGPAAGFDGTSHGFSAPAWLLTPDGWFERGRLTVHLQGEEVVADLGALGRVSLWRGVRALECRYLLVPGSQSRWVAEWWSPIAAPIAIRLRLAWMRPQAAADTLVLLVRGGG